MLSQRRDEAAAIRFFRQTIDRNGWPDKVVIEQAIVRHSSEDNGARGANLAGLDNMNIALILVGWCWLIEVLQVKYLNNVIEQDHRFIKKITRPMKGFKSYHAAQATLAGIETAHMIRKGQLGGVGRSPFQTFAELAG